MKSTPDSPKRLSSRFSSSPLTRYLIPLVLGLLAIGLLGTLVLIVLSLLGWTPGAFPF